MDRRRARSTLAAALASTLLVSAGVAVVSAAPSEKGRCNSKKFACEAVTSESTTSTTSATSTTTAPPADTTAPVATITSPTEGTTVGPGLVAVGSSSDNTGVARVDVRVDSGSWRTAVGTAPWSATIDTAGWAAGSSHTITARAVDGAGSLSQIASVTVLGATTSSPPVTGDPSVAPATQGTWVSPEGATIDVATAGAWTVREIYRMLLENSAAAGDLDRIAPGLTIRVQDTYGSGANTSAVGNPGAYSSVETTIWLKGVASTFAAYPDVQFGHEYGHAWTRFHLYLGDGGDWTSYLIGRGLNGDPRLESSYSWSKAEIIADDYRLLFGSAAAVAGRPTHMNGDIPMPGEVRGLREYLLGGFRVL